MGTGVELVLSLFGRWSVIALPCTRKYTVSAMFVA
jgi:hypothetical protein